MNLYSIIENQLRDQFEVIIVFLQDAVNGLNSEGVLPKTLEMLFELSINCFAVKNDILARGYDTNLIYSKIKVISYDDLVDLMVQSDSISSWL